MHKGQIASARLPSRTNGPRESRKGTKSARDHQDFLLLPSGVKFGSNDQSTVVDPLAMLRHCIGYLASHPDEYGTDLQGILQRECLSVLQLKASEAALVTDTGNSTGGHASFLPAISKRTTPGVGRPAAARSPADDTLFGYGGVKLQHPEGGFMALLEAEEHNNTDLYVPASQQRRALTAPVDGAASLPVAAEGIDWSDAAMDDQYLPLEPPSRAVAEILNSRRPVVIDGTSYEVAFLRNQLNQVEAAFNSKCIRMHELNEENKRLASQVESSENSAEKWLHAYNSMQSQLEAVKRQMEGWKEKAVDAQHLLATQGTAAGAQSRKGGGGQQGELKVEITKLTQIWRDTEKALQECRRAFENSEKEANQSHDHLSDAFHYIERLERRIHRRNQYIDLSARRQRSLEEKYEKLMWCFQEMGSMKGAYSYADFLLADNPIWSLILFAWTACSLGSFIPGAKTRHHAQGPLALQPSPGGGYFSHSHYDLSLIREVISNEVTSRWERKARRRLRTNLHGTVGCRVLRPWNPYTIDFLGGEDSNPDENHLSRRSIPLLTIGGVLSSLRTPTAEDGSGGVDVAEVANSGEYDHSTLRFFLRSFWAARLRHFKMNMKKRVEQAAREFRKKSLPGGGDNDEDDNDEDKNSDDDDDGDDEDASSSEQNFIASLIVFAARFTNGGAAISANIDKATGKEILVAIRGRILESNPDAQLNGRVLFASIINARARRPVPPSEPDPPEPAPLTAKTQELLAALYYHTMDFKAVDADFRLFYLVSHQLIPEMVGINFYASLEAFKEEALQRLHLYATRDQARAAAEAASLVGIDRAAADDGTNPFRDDSSLAALKKVSKLIDETPLVDEDESIEVDSDGEGYGSIFANSGAPRALDQYETDRHGNLYKKRASQSTAAGSSRPQTGVSVATTADTRIGSGIEEGRQLTHNIRAYLEELYERRGLAFKGDTNENGREGNSNDKRPDTAQSATSTKAGENGGRVGGGVPRRWVEIDSYIRDALGPHASLLKEYDAAASSKDKVHKNLTLKAQRDRRAGNLSTSSTLSAARGLLPIDDVLAIFRHHGFAQYAVTACGSPRFSLADLLCPPESDDPDAYLPPLERIGQYPINESQLRLIKFALALDQPSALVRVSTLFGFDTHTGSPSHLYSVYLNLTLDAVIQQQKLLMQITLWSCASRHERYASEGAEDCNGTIPISFLKKGITNSFAKFGVAREQAHALTAHLVNYDKILRMEDDVRLEQFADAPFYMNSPAEEPGAAAAAEGDNEWDMQEEAETCSLLNLAFALRSTWLIWGPELAASAERVMRSCVAIPPDHAAPLHLFPPSMPGLDILGLSELPAADYTKLMQFQFTHTAKQRYLQAARRLAAGNAGDQNPLRRALNMRLEQERQQQQQQQEQQEQQKETKSTSSKSGTGKKENAMKKTSIDAGSTKAGESTRDAATISPPPPPVVDKTALPDGYYPNYRTVMVECTMPSEEDAEGKAGHSKKSSKKSAAAAAGGAKANSSTDKTAASLENPSALDCKTFDNTLFDLARVLGATVDVNPLDSAAGGGKKKGKKASKSSKKHGSDVRGFISAQSDENVSASFSTLRDRMLQFVGRQQVETEAKLEKAAAQAAAAAAAPSPSSPGNASLAASPEESDLNAGSVLKSATSFSRRRPGGGGAAGPPGGRDLLWHPVFDLYDSGDEGAEDAEGNSIQDANDSESQSPKTGLRGFNMPQQSCMKVSALYPGCAVLHTL